MTSKYTTTIGADPEFFVCDKATAVPVPACRKFGGEKKAPMFLSPDGGYLEDGCTVEFNVTPSVTLAETRKKIENLILIFLNQHNAYEITRYSSATFDKKTLESLPEAMHIGCSPDLFAYGLRVAPSVQKFGSTRFAGGHIHLGIDPWPEGLDKALVIKFLDLMTVLPLLGHSDKGRYPFYGHPGLYRETDYGVEHRSPDNIWCNPAFYASTGAATRKFVDDIVYNFDKSIYLLKECLEFDGHGARLNDNIRQSVKAWGVEGRMNTMSAIESSRNLSNYTKTHTEVHGNLINWLNERKRPRNRPSPKLHPNW